MCGVYSSPHRSVHDLHSEGITPWSAKVPSRAPKTTFSSSFYLTTNFTPQYKQSCTWHHLLPRAAINQFPTGRGIAPSLVKVSISHPTPVFSFFSFREMMSTTVSTPMKLKRVEDKKTKRSLSRPFISNAHCVHHLTITTPRL